MSLYRQLWISILALMLIAFIASFTVSLYTAKSYLEQQLYTQSTDNAASLALSMTQQSKDEVTLELQVSALFDSGHFRLVRFTDVNGQIVVERQSQTVPDKVPDWFVRMIPLASQPGTAIVNDGWKQAGKVTVEAHNRYAYQSLWKGTLSLLGWITLAGLGAVLLARLWLKWFTRPIHDMVQQAQAITERRFITVDEPRVLELQTVVRAMNKMVERLKTLFNEQAEHIRQLHDEANRDALTGLANRSFFLGRLTQMLCSEKAALHGALLIIRIHDLAGLNHRAGREKTDEFLQCSGNELAQAILGQEPALAARLNGADFALLLPGAEIGPARDQAEALLEQFGTLYRRGFTDDSRPASCGFTLYQHGEEAAEVMARADTALLRAEMAPERIASSVNLSTSRHPNLDWQTQLRQALAENRFELAYFPVYSRDWKLLHRESALRLRLAGSGELIPAGHFMPYVLRLGMAAEIDLLAVRLALQEIQTTQQAIAVNLSADSIRSATFRQQLQTELESAGTQASQLWLEINEFGLRDEMAILAAFAAQIARHGCKIGIEHFGRHVFDTIPQLYELHLGYLKIDGSFIHDLDKQPGNQYLIRAIASVASGMGILTIAEQISTEMEWQMVVSLGIDGGTGPAMHQPGPD